MKSIFSYEILENGIPQLFERQAAAVKDKLAVKDEEKMLSYTELNSKANEIAHRLIQLQINGCQPIIIYLQQGVDFITGILGILKAGHTYVPLDPSFPNERNQFVVGDTKARYILTNSENFKNSKELVGQNCIIINIDDSGNFQQTNPMLDLNIHQPAFIIYTSGSTGQPKGIPQSHQNVVHGFMRRTHIHNITESDRMSLLYSCSVMGSVYGIFGALLNGASLISYNITLNGLTALPDWLVDEKISVYHSVSSVFRHLGHFLGRQEWYPHMRLVIFGGEKVPFRNIELVRIYFPDSCQIAVGLGSTETGTVLSYIIDNETTFINNIVPLGNPAPDIEIILLDENGQPVEINEVGEICIKSKFIAKTYWNSPEKSKEVFELCENDPSTVIYHSGDLGLRNKEGIYFHKGRKDKQVKINGFRVEMSEVDLVMLKHPDVEEAYTKLFDFDDHPQLVCFYEGKEIQHQDLRKYLVQFLPSHMIPARLIYLDKIPRTANGKLDPSKLSPDLITVDNQVNKETVKPIEHPMAGFLTRIWEELLGQSPVDPNANFFESGGNSLLAARLIAELENRTDQRIPMSTLIQHATINSLLPVISQTNVNQSWSPIVPIKIDCDGPPFYCIHGVGGNVLNYYALAEKLGKHYKFYGVQAMGLSSDHKVQTDIPSMARTYLQEILKIHPGGPVHLGGASFGGRVAYEMATHLHSLDLEPGIVALIDTSVTYGQNKPDGPKTNTSPGVNDKWKRIRYHWNDFLQTKNDQKVAFISRKLKTIQRRRENAKWQKKYQDEITAHGSIPQYLQDVKQANYMAAKTYRIGNFSGKVHLFKAMTRGFSLVKDHDMGWGRFVEGGVEIRNIPGTHTSILEPPQVDILAEAIAECIHTWEQH